MKKELIHLFDYKIFVQTDFELARKRGAKRETIAFGSYESAEIMFLNRYHTASSLNLKEHEPQQHADIVVNNNNIDSPYFL
ncbi:hypothetical protein LSPCS325_47100 [Lysinibacillus sp. CTST325]